MAKRPTIQMVADLAGVSRGTVDRVLNNRSYVRADVRERILAAIAETGYVSPREAHQQQLAESRKPLRLGVLLPNWESQFREEILQGIEKGRNELEPAGVQVVVRTCKTDIPQEAIGHLTDFSAEKVDGIAVCALNDRSIAQCVSDLAAAGIPCITFNSDLPDSHRLCYVGQDIHQAGRIAAELMSKCVSPSDDILATVGNLKFDGHRQRLLGFQERLAELGYAEEHVLVSETFNDYHTTVSVVSEAIAAHPHLKGIYMANLSVSGCAEAVRAAGKKGAIRIICHDINDSIRQLLLGGLVDFTIPQDMVQQGYAPLILLTNYLRKGQLPAPERLNRSIQILCAENVIPQ